MLPVNSPPPRLFWTSSTLEGFVWWNHIWVRPLPHFVLHPDELCEPIQIIGCRPPEISRKPRFPVSVRYLVPNLLHNGRLGVSPRIKLYTADKRDVGPEIAMSPAAVDADEDSKGRRCPPRVLCAAVSAPRVFWAKHCSLDALLWIVHRFCVRLFDREKRSFSCEDATF